MRIQRLTGPKRSFELMLSDPVVVLSNTTVGIHKWERWANTYKCKVYLQGNTDSSVRDKSLNFYIAALPIDLLELEFTDTSVDVDQSRLTENQRKQLHHLDVPVTLVASSPARYMLPQPMIEAIYSSYIENACKEYNLTASTTDIDL